jgi:hypothetical protein
MAAELEAEIQRDGILTSKRLSLPLKTAPEIHGVFSWVLLQVIF